MDSCGYVWIAKEPLKISDELLLLTKKINELISIERFRELAIGGDYLDYIHSRNESDSWVGGIWVGRREYPPLE